MKIVCLQNVAIFMGLLVVSCVDANYIGCYWLPDDWSTDGYFISNMSGQACKQHCYPYYRYAGVSITDCYCGRKLNGVALDDSECSVPCPDPQYMGTCGSNKKMSVYDTGGVVVAHPDGYIGCYMLMSSDLNTSFSDNSGRICKNHCFPQYRYAGTSFERCYCVKILFESEIQPVCTAQCPGRNSVKETCGGIHSMTTYDAQKTTTTHSTTTATTHSAVLKTSTTKSVTPTVNSPSVNTKPTKNQVLTTDETTANTTTSSSLENISITGCVFICVAVAVGLVVINIVVLCVCKKNRRSKQGHKAQIDNYGYISPVNVTELDDTTPHVNTFQLRNEVTTNWAGTSSNMYEDLSSKAAESQYTDLV